MVATFDWKVILAPVAILALLVSTNALVAQVEGDLEAQLDANPFEGTGDGKKDGTPLKLNNLKLPQDILTKLPAGTEWLKDLDKLRLPDDLQLDLPDDFDLGDLDFALPENFNFELPPGTIFDPATGKLKLPNGGNIKLPDGRDFKLPPGTTLDLPPEMVERLLKEGLPAGALDSARTLRMRDIPPGTHVGMDPPALPDGGKLNLPAGTELQLPDGTRVPPEALAGLLPFLLPKGTIIDIPAGMPGDNGLPMEIPVEGEAPASDTPKRTPIATDIDTYPTRIRKGEPFIVSGYVREAATGRDVAGAPVVVYLNETKDTPGVLVGRGVTGTNGRFDIQVELPADKPASNYQLVNHAGAFDSKNGVRYADGWGDPPIETFAATTARLEFPARDGLGSTTTLRGTLYDDLGAPVGLARVDLLVDGVLARTSTTDAQGIAVFTHKFPNVGTYTVAMRYGGNDHYDPSTSERGTIAIDDVALDVSPKHVTARGEEVTLSGRVLISGTPARGQQVIVTSAFGGAATVTTAGDGTFTRTVTIPRDAAVGATSATYRLVSYDVTKKQDIEVHARGVLNVTAPMRALITRGVEATVTLVDHAGTPIDGRSISIRITGPGGTDVAPATTGTRTVTRPLVPPQAIDGEYVLTATLVNDAFVTAEPVTQGVTLGRLDAVWDLPTTALRGQSLATYATFTFADAPFDREPVAFTLFREEGRTTKADGTMSWTIDVPTSAPLGTTTARLHTVAMETSWLKEIRIVALPRIALDAPGPFDPADGVLVKLALTDDLGAPLRDHRITLELASGEWSHRTTVQTDADGTWQGTLETAGAPALPMTITATHPVQGDHMEARATATAAVKAARFGRLPLWPLLVGVPLVAAVAGGGALVARHRKRPAMAAAVVATPAPDAPLELRFPVDGPRVWGVHESISLEAHARRPMSEALRLRGPDLDRTLVWDDRIARTGLAFARPGEATLQASCGDAHVEATIRIVHYHREISREFDEIIRRARKVDATIGKRTTPQELEWILGHRLGPETHEALADVARIMDLANYSEHRVGRPEYIRFHQAYETLLTWLPEATR